MSVNSTTTNISSTQVSNTIIVLNILLKQYVTHLPLVLTIFGLIGFLGNILTYLQAELRTNTCCIYSFCGSIVDIITLLFNSFSMYINSFYKVYIPWIDLPYLCKFQKYFLGFLPYLSINFLLISIIDRYACTCSLTSRIRRLNQIKMVPWMISITILSSCIISIRSPIFFDYKVGIGCVATLALTNNILYTIFNGLMQPIIMFIFVLLTFRNVHNSRRRVGGRGTLNSNRSRNQFIVMILTQVFATAIISLQWMIFFMYYYIPVNSSRTSEQQTIITFIFILTNYCYYLNNVKSFYLSMLTSRLFRETFFKALIRLLPRYYRQRWQRTQTMIAMMNLTRTNAQPVTLQGMATVF